MHPVQVRLRDDVHGLRKPRQLLIGLDAKFFRAVARAECAELQVNTVGLDRKAECLAVQRKPGTDREMPLILGLMPVLPRHVYHAENFEQTTLNAVGSGPYVVTEVSPGRLLKLRRDPGYWGRNLAVSRATSTGTLKGFWM